MTTTHEGPLHEIVALACRAPSVHNSQPWHWCVDGGTVSLFADHARQLPHADPDGRDLVLSCGAALHHLRVAAAAKGWSARVHRMPNPNNDSQLATITFEHRREPVEAEAALDALMHRRTDRRRMSPWPVDRDEVTALLQIAGRSGVVAFAVVSAPARRLMLNLLGAADETQRRDPGYVSEITAWVDRADTEGVPSASLPRHRPAVGAEGASTRFPSGTLVGGPDGADQAMGALLVICSSSDDVASRLRAGEALSAILLRSTADGLTAVTLSQAVEVDRVRELLRAELLDDMALPQVLVAVGRPERDLGPLAPTPRRPVDEVISTPATLPSRFGPYQRV